MRGDSAVKANLGTPSGYKRMETLTCHTCKASFKIIHQLQFADPARAGKQVIILRSILAGDHVDPNFKEHLKSYEGLEDE